MEIVSASGSAVRNFIDTFLKCFLTNRAVALDRFSVWLKTFAEVGRLANYLLLHYDDLLVRILANDEPYRTGWDYWVCHAVIEVVESPYNKTGGLGGWGDGG